MWRHSTAHRHCHCPPATAHLPRPTLSITVSCRPRGKLRSLFAPPICQRFHRNRPQPLNSPSSVRPLLSLSLHSPSSSCRGVSDAARMRTSAFHHRRALQSSAALSDLLLCTVSCCVVTAPFCGCFDDCSSCMMSYFLPCVQFGFNAQVRSSVPSTPLAVQQGAAHSARSMFVFLHVAFVHSGGRRRLLPVLPGVPGVLALRILLHSPWTAEREDTNQTGTATGRRSINRCGHTLCS